MRFKGRGALLASVVLAAALLAIPIARGETVPCAPGTTATAHRAGAAIEPQPAGAPAVCRSYTGYAGGESRIEVDNDGAVFFSPAPYLRGVGSVGYGPDQEETAPQWMFQNGGIAVSLDGGGTWTRKLPLNSSWTMDDALSYFDRRTNRYFWMPLNSSPFPNIEEGGPGPREQGVLTESRILSTDDKGESWKIGSAIGVISDRAPLVAAPAPGGQPRPDGYDNVVYYCHVFGTNTGTCSKSLDGGQTWTLTGRSHGQGVHPECEGAQEGTGRSGWHSLAPAPDGTLYEVVTCNGVAYLAASIDEGATWPIVVEEPLPHAGDLRSDTAGNLYLAQLTGGNHLTVSVSIDRGETWSGDVDVTMPGIEVVQNNWYYTVTDPGQLTFTYNGRRSNGAYFDGFITTTRASLAEVENGSAVFWSAQVNDSDVPLMYGDAIQGVGIPVGPARTPPPQTNQLGSAIDPTTGNRWASFTEDCGPTPGAERCTAQHNQTRGLAAWLDWP